MKLPSAILADDRTILVEAFRALLQPHCEIVATVSDGRALVELASNLKPDVINHYSARRHATIEWTGSRAPVEGNCNDS